MIKKNILIANSVGKDEKGNQYILFPSRWSACVGKTKSFNFYPYELGYLSSLLKNSKKYDVKMIDGNYEKLDWKEYYEKYKKEKPDYLVMESSSVVYKYDLKFALKFKKRYGTVLIFCGQHATAFPEQVRNDGVDYVCEGEYEMTVLDIIEGKNKKNILGLYPNKRRELLDIKQLPFPEDSDIKRINYSGIGGSAYKEIEMFATRGCPMNCVFCVARQTYYGKSNFRKRKITDVINEIKYLKNKYRDLEGIFFNEENHNTDKKYILDLCDSIVKENLDDLKYEAMCGYWTMDREMLAAMKRAGYYKLRIGVETASVKTSKGMKKNINIKKMMKVLKEAKNLGIKMYGTFTFGAPESNKAEDEKTLKFINKLLKRDLLDDFQASVCTPQPGTPFFDYLKNKHYLLTENWSEYNGSTAIYEYPDYKKKDIEENMIKAAKIYLRSLIRKKGIIKTVTDQIKKDGLKDSIIKAVNYIR